MISPKATQHSELTPVLLFKYYNLFTVSPNKSTGMLFIYFLLVCYSGKGGGGWVGGCLSSINPTILVELL